VIYPLTDRLFNFYWSYHFSLYASYTCTKPIKWTTLSLFTSSRTQPSSLASLYRIDTVPINQKIKNIQAENKLLEERISALESLLVEIKSFSLFILFTFYFLLLYREVHNLNKLKFANIYILIPVPNTMLIKQWPRCDRNLGINYWNLSDTDNGRLLHSICKECRE
jgi:hypothetical protein